MKHGKSIVILAALVLSACANQNNNGASPVSKSSSSAAVGTFKSGSMGMAFDESGTLTSSSYKEFLTIGANSVEVTKTCQLGLDKVTVKVSAPAVVSGNHFEVKKAQEETKKVGAADCTAKIAAGVTAFEVKDNGLTITNAEGTLFYGYRVGQAPSKMEKVKAGLKVIGNGAYNAVRTLGEATSQSGL